jgi:hypothetical protein
MFLEQIYDNIGFWRHFVFGDHFLKIKTPKEAFLTKLSTDLHQKIILHKATRWRFS